MKRRPLVAVLLLASAAMVAGCSSTPQRLPGEAPWLGGRLSLRVDASATQAAVNLSAGFELQASGANGELRLNTPLGTQLALARWQPGLVQLLTPQGEQTFPDLDTLSRSALGEALPLAALPDWLAGRPWPAAKATLNEAGFEQLGWQVFTQRKAEGQIEARRSTPPAVVLRIRLDNPEP